MSPDYRESHANKPLKPEKEPSSQGEKIENEKNDPKPTPNTNPTPNTEDKDADTKPVDGEIGNG